MLEDTPNLIVTAVAGITALFLVVAVVYACVSEADRDAAARTVGAEVDDEDLEGGQPGSRESFISEQTRIIKERKAEEERRKLEADQQAALALEAEKARQIEQELEAKKRAEEEAYQAEKAARLQEQRVQAAEVAKRREQAAAQAEAEAEAEALAKAAAAQAHAEAEAEAAAKEDFPDVIDDDATSRQAGTAFGGNGIGNGQELAHVQTTDKMIKEMARGEYAPRPAKPVGPNVLRVETHKSRRQSALDSPYGKMLLNSQGGNKQSVAQLLYSAYPGLGLTVMQAFLDEVGIEFETDLGLIEEEDVRNLDTNKFDSDTQEKLWKAVCRHRDKVGKKATSLRRSIQVVDPSIIPSEENGAPVDLPGWYARFEIPPGTQTILADLGVESLNDVDYLEKADLVDGGVPKDVIEVVMNAIALKKLQDRRAGPRGRAVMF